MVRIYYYEKDPENKGRGAGFYYHKGKGRFSKHYLSFGYFISSKPKVRRIK